MKNTLLLLVGIGLFTGLNAWSADYECSLRGSPGHDPHGLSVSGPEGNEMASLRVQDDWFLGSRNVPANANPDWTRFLGFEGYPQDSADYIHVFLSKDIMAGRAGLMKIRFFIDTFDRIEFYECALIDG